MFWIVILLVVIFSILRKILANRILKPILLCEEWTHHLNRYCAVSKSNPYFIKYYRLKEELERRQGVVESIMSSKFLRLCTNLLLPSERKYYQEFVDGIPELKEKTDNTYADYLEFMEQKV